MKWFEWILSFFTYFNLGRNKWNIIGVIWLILLTYMAYSRFRWHFKNHYSHNPFTSPSKVILTLSAFLTSFYSIFLIQMCMDDFITMPINIVFGSWYLIAPHLGAFSFFKWFMFKWDVYAMILSIFLLFNASGLWRFFQFTKWSALWLTATVFLQFILASQGIFYFLNLAEYERIFAYWVSYPWFRLLTGLFATSIIKKPVVMK